MPSGKKDGRIVADIGESLKRRFKAILLIKGISMTQWLQSVIGEFVSNNKHVRGIESEEEDV
jgi:hypothetical protein